MSSLVRASAPLLASTNLPRSFGRYVLFDFIGKGGMAEIFLARAGTELGGARLCVVKKILPAFAEHPQFAEMLTFEAKLAAQLNHANIVQVFDLGRADGELFIAMEYVEGFDLNQLLRRCTQRKVPLPFDFAIRIVTEVLAGLDYAHRRVDEAGRALGVVHRDVSPSNVLVSLDGEVKLCDFGIAHANDLVSGAGLGDEALKGKAGYMSPEHARGEPIDARADVYAAGILLWELLAGRRMYRAEGRESLLDVARQAEVPPLKTRDLPEEERLRAIVQRALATSKDARYASAAAMRRDLEEYLAAAQVTASALRLGTWMRETFGADGKDDNPFAERRARERALPRASAPRAADVVAHDVDDAGWDDVPSPIAIEIARPYDAPFEGGTPTTIVPPPLDVDPDWSPVPPDPFRIAPSDPARVENATKFTSGIVVKPKRPPYWVGAVLLFLIAAIAFVLSRR